MASQHERRVHPRYVYPGEVFVVPGGEGEAHPGRIVDLSLEGCLIRLPGTPALAKALFVDLSFRSGDLAFRASGTVRSQRSQADGSLLIGISLHALGTRGRAELNELLASLKKSKR